MAHINRYPRMVHDYFVDQLRRIERESNLRRASLKTKSDAERYVSEVREKIRACFGPEPERTPLNARTVGIIERDQYRIEKIIFESRPGFLVTGNLYIPENGNLPAPCVLGTCGHSDNGKSYDLYQSFSQGLARQGYVVFIYDPISQGERLQYFDDDGNRCFTSNTLAHNYAGNQQSLVGEFFGSWRLWDGIRALDYLLSREEVDPRHVGVTGNSGGGTMTTWLCGVETRFTMAAPGCFITTFRRNLENELPADIEQCPPNALALGLDESDFLAAIAPKPLIILAKEQDFFDIRGTEEAYSRLKHLYRLLGAEENIELFIGPGGHGYSRENREAMYRFFNRITGISDRTTEPELQIEEESALWCAPNGQIKNLGSKPIYVFTREKSQSLAKSRPSGMDESELARRVAGRLGLSDYVAKRRELTPPDYDIQPMSRWCPRLPLPKSTFCSYGVETEPGIRAIVYLLGENQIGYRPPRDIERAILSVSHVSGEKELREEALIAQLLESEPDSAFYTCDVRGIGESQPNTCSQGAFLRGYGSDYFYTAHSLMLGRPYVGQKTFDVLRVIDWLTSLGHEKIHLVGLGWGSIPATFAALLSESVVQVTLKNALTSYSDIAESKGYSWPVSCFVPGVLEDFDLPDCYRALHRKQLTIIEPWGAMDARPRPDFGQNSPDL